jgi:replicative DNA helicase
VWNACGKISYHHCFSSFRFPLKFAALRLEAMMTPIYSKRVLNNMAVRNTGSDASVPRTLALPDNLDAERFVLGAIMSSDTAFLQVAGTLTADDFSLEKHKRIFLRMSELHERGVKIDRVTVANELMKQGQLQSVDGLSYLVSLDDGLPSLYNLDSYVAIVKEKSLLRRIIAVAQDSINRCIDCNEDATQILGAIEEAFIKINDGQAKNSLASPAQIITEYEGGINAFLDTMLLHEV